MAAAELPRLLSELVSRGDLIVPPYPAVALRLRRLVETEDFSLSEVAEAASADSALAAALLRVANSSLYGPSPAPITNLARAVHRLGARAVASIATAATIGAGAVAAGPLIDVKYKVWHRSVTCALVCQRFADRELVDPDEAFLAGLLHGFGRSVAVACLERVLPSLAQKKLSLAEWMQAAEPFRGELARRVAEQWQLPEALIRVAVGDPTDQSPGPMSALVALGESIAQAIESGYSAERIAEGAAALLERRALEAFLEGLPSAIDALVQPPGPSHRPKASAVSAPLSALTGSLRPVSLPVMDVRNRREPIRLAAIALSVDGIVLLAPRPMQPSCVARLSLGEGPSAIEGWYTVVLCAPQGVQFRVELQPFAPSHETRQFLRDYGKTPSG